MPTDPIRRFLLGRLCLVMLLSSSTQTVPAQGPEASEVSVRVVDMDGQPVEGATLAGTFRLHEPIRLFGFSDDEGAGRVKWPAEEEHFRLLIRGEGYGLVDHNLSRGDRNAIKAVTIKLPPAVQISGRLVDEQGQPAAGVRLRPYKILKFERGKSLAEVAAEAKWVGDLEDAGWPVCEVLPSSEMLLPWVETDAQGRFSIDSVAPDQLAGLFAIGERTAATTILVRTDDGPEFTIRTARGLPDALVHTPQDFSHTVAPSVPVVGTITEAGIAKPVGLATVSPWRAPGFSFYLAQRLMQVQTDLFGNYKLIGLGTDSDRIYAVPPPGLPLVPVERRTKIQPGTALHTLDMQMPPGVKVQGRVTDLNTGEPVRGSVSSYVFPDNPLLKALEPTSLSIDRHSAQIGDDGRYEIFVLPGPGILALGPSSSVSQNYRRGIGWDKIDHHIYRENGSRTLFRTEPSMLTAYNETQLFEVTVPPAPATFEFDMVVGERRIDVPLSFTRGEEGGRLPTNVYYSSATPDDPGFSLYARGYSSSPGGSEDARIRFFEGDKARFVQACDSDKQLAGWTSVSPDDEAATIELNEAATVRGRVLKADGTPLADAALRTPSPHDPTQQRALLPSQPDGAGYYPSTDQDGRFQFVGLTADLPLTVELKIYNAAGNKVLDHRYLFEDLEFKPGETRDLGDLRLDTLRERKPE